MTDTLSSNPYEPIFAAQKALFRTGATRAREWRLDQLARMERMVSENEAELQDAVKSDFKTASQEYVFETQAAIGEVVFQRSQLDDWMKPVTRGARFMVPMARSRNVSIQSLVRSRVTGRVLSAEDRLVKKFRFPPLVEPTGTYLTQIRRVPEMSVDQEYALAKSWRERGDEESERRLIASQLRLVAKIAWSYRGYGLPFFKLIHEGNRALVGAVRRFDPGRGFRLAAFARWQIEGALVEYVLAARPQVQAESAVEKMKLFFDLYRVKARLSALWNSGFHTHL